MIAYVGIYCNCLNLQANSDSSGIYDSNNLLLHCAIKWLILNERSFIRRRSIWWFSKRAIYHLSNKFKYTKNEMQPNENIIYQLDGDIILKPQLLFWFLWVMIPCEFYIEIIFKLNENVRTLFDEPTGNPLMLFVLTFAKWCGCIISFSLSHIITNCHATVFHIQLWLFIIIWQTEMWKSLLFISTKCYKFHHEN